MSYLIVPDLDEEPWDTLGGELCEFLEERAVFGPGDLAGQPAVISPEKRALIYRWYEVYPKGHRYAGRRRFKRAGWSVRKGLAKTELEGWISYAELHPEAPVRCDGFDAHGEPVGRPVAYPYIPMLAYNKDQVEELAYAVLMYVCEHGPDSDLFDISLERIMRLNDRGHDDGRAAPVAQSPNARDGARTTFQAFDEPHRMYLPRLLAAHQTMANNLTKRPAADAWSLYVGTAGEIGQGSIAESLHKEAEAMRDGKRDRDPRFFYFHRDAGTVHDGRDKAVTGHNLATKAGRIAAIREATGPDGEYGPGQFDDISELYTRPDTDRAYWERVQLNLWRTSDRQAFDVDGLTIVDDFIEPRSFVTAGFDGALFKDSTAIVLTDIFTGVRQLWALWERPPARDGVEVEWEAPIGEINASVDELMLTMRVIRWNGDPPHYLESHAQWAGKYPDVVEEWWTNRVAAMAYAVRNYQQGHRDGTIKYAKDDRPYDGSHIQNETMGQALRRHIGNAGKHAVNMFDDDGRQMFILEKIEPDRKFDACMADILANEARLDVLADPKLLTKMTTGTSTTFKRLR